MGFDITQNTTPDDGHDTGKADQRAHHAACRHALVMKQQMGKHHGQHRHGAKDDTRQAGINVGLAPGQQDHGNDLGHHAQHEQGTPDTPHGRQALPTEP